MATEHSALDPEPDPWLWAQRLSLVGLFVMALLLGLHATQSVVVPIIVAWVITTILLPLVTWLEAKRINRSLVSLMVATGFFLVILLAIGVLSLPLASWVGRADELRSLLRDKLHLLSEPLAFFSEIDRSLQEVSGSAPKATGLDMSSASIARGILETLSPIVSEFLLFFVALVFNLIYSREIIQGIAFIFTDADFQRRVLAALHDIEKSMSVYFGTCALVNIGLSITTAIMTGLLGFPQPVLWGVFAAIMNFIPYVGVAIVIGTLFLIGLMTFDTLGHAALGPLIYLGMTTLEGQFITPSLVSHRLTINPFLIFIAIAFWSYLWGPIGAFLAVPLVMSSLIACRHLLAKKPVHGRSGPAV